MAGLDEILARAIAYKIEGRYDQAIADLTAILEQNSEHAEAHHQIGLVFGFVGRLTSHWLNWKRRRDWRPKTC